MEYDYVTGKDSQGEIVDGSGTIQGREVADVEVQTQIAKNEQTFRSITTRTYRVR
jgi:hypothetical protein